MRMKKNLKQIIIFFLILFNALFSLSMLHANEIEGESFSKYYSKVEFIDSNKIKISKNLTLKNNYDKSILPGQIEFRVGSGTLDSATSINMSNIVVKDSNGRNISYTYREFEDYSSLILDIYYPLLSGFEYEFELIYELNLGRSGIFFRNLQIPLKDSSIPIEDGTFEVILPKRNYFTYAGELNEFAEIRGNRGVWDLQNNFPNTVEFEYSIIPIRTSWMRGSYLFWILVNVMMFAFLVYQIRKEVVKVKNQEVEE